MELKTNYKRHPLTDDRLNQEYKIELPKVDLKNKKLAIFTIGPVQSFISAAKKVKEFWAGSYLLSLLTWQAIEHTIKEAGEESIIFPMVLEQPFYKRFIKNQSDIKNLEMPTLPNRFMALLDENNAEQILEECEDKVHEKLYDILENPVLNLKNSSDFKSAREQVDNLLEIYWVAIPATEDINDLSRKYEDLKGKEANIKNTYTTLTGLAEELLGSRKNLRNFDHVEETGKKCFICGERSEIYSINYEDENRKTCSICSLKRNLEKYFNNVISPENDIYYPSVIEIAAMDYKEELLKNLKEDNKLQDVIDLYKNELDEDYRTKLPTRWNDKGVEERKFLEISGDYFDLDGERIKDNSQIIRMISGLNKKYDLKLNKYYGLVYLDGDSMGKWVSGELIDKEMSPEIHALISKALINYSLKFAKKIVEKNGRKGKVIYAGGDDVVAFINMDDFFDTIRDLSAYFSGSIDDNGVVDLFNKNGIVEYEGEQLLTLGSKASISLGACIAHYKEPLNLVIKKAQAMEKMAKENKIIVDGTIKQKDAMAIGLIKNSGEIRETTNKWIYKDVDIIKDGIKPLIELIQEEKLSRSFVYILKEEFQLIDNKQNAYASKIINSEINRLINKKEENLKQEDKEKLKNALNNLMLIFNTDHIDIDNIDNFISLLEILFFIGKRGG